MSIEGFTPSEQPTPPPQQEEIKDQMTLDLEKKKLFAEQWSTAALEFGYTAKEDDGNNKVFEKDGQILTLITSTTKNGLAIFEYPNVPLIKRSTITFSHSGEGDTENVKDIFKQTLKKYNERYNQIKFDEVDKSFNTPVISIGTEAGFTTKKVNNGRTILTRGNDTVIFQHMGHIGPEGQRYVLIESTKNGRTNSSAIEWINGISAETIRDILDQ
jgi:hypothetical protein